MSTRILLADDHVLVRDGLAALLDREPDFEVIGEAEDGEEALAGVERLKPDVAILDVAMPAITGIEVARRLREIESPTAVVLLSMHHEPAFVTAGLDAGVLGYVVKSAVRSELIEAVRAAAQGQLYLSPRVATAVVAELRAGEPPGEPDLSAREREIVCLLARGLLNKEIATRLQISRRTVEGHRAVIMRKLGIDHLPGLVKYAIRHHLVALEE
jgi:DNA-binding NarL/FixJ family response regulator